MTTTKTATLADAAAHIRALIAENERVVAELPAEADAYVLGQWIGRGLGLQKALTAVLNAGTEGA